MRRKAEKGFLEARPFLVDHPPDETRAENAPGHAGENAFVGHFRQRAIDDEGGQQFSQRSRAALAFFGAGAKRGEAVGHAQALDVVVAVWPNSIFFASSVIGAVRTDLFAELIGAHHRRAGADRLEPALQMREIVEVLVLRFHGTIQG